MTKNYMKIKIGLLIAVLMGLPTAGFAQVDSSLIMGSSYVTGTDSGFEVRMNNYQSTSDVVSVLTIADAAVADINSAMFMDKTGWVKLTPYQLGSDVTAKFISDTGFDSGASRVISLRINFKKPNNYVVGFSLQNSNGQTLSSAAAPMIVSGSILGSILGESITVSFTRNLYVGSRGNDVTALQNKLTAEGFYSGPITGYFGNLTRAGVKKYQAAHGISAVGHVGPQTRASLNQ